MATTVRRLGLDTEAPIELDMIVSLLEGNVMAKVNCVQASSLGNLTAPFVRAIYCAARGKQSPSFQAIPIRGWQRKLQLVL